ncbi:MAG: hypothetical protein AB8B54_04870 [Sphingorhabdus sp.]
MPNVNNAKAVIVDHGMKPTFSISRRLLRRLLPISEITAIVPDRPQSTIHSGGMGL